MGKKSFFNFLTLSVALIGLLSITVLARQPQSTTSKAAPPINFTASFGPKGTPDATWDTAGELISILTQNEIGTIVKSVYTYDGGQNVFVSGSDPIIAGKGYLIDFFHNPGNKFYKLFNSYTPVSLQSYILPLSSEGPSGFDFGNLISIPEGVMASLGKRMRAEDFCTLLNNKGAGVTQIASTTKAVFQKTHLYNENMVFHTCGTRADNFSVTSGVGYFVYVGSSTSVTLP